MTLPSNGRNFLVVWAHIGFIDNVPQETPIFGVLVTLRPFAASAPFVICDDPSGQRKVAVASDGTDYFVAWLDNRDHPPGSYQPYAQSVFGTKVSGDGIVANRKGIAIDKTGAGKEGLAIASNGTDYLVVWDDVGDGRRAIYGCHISTNGQPMEGSFRLSSGEGTEFRPKLISDGKDYLAAWHRLSPRGEYATPITKNGVVLAPNGIQMLSSAHEVELRCVAGKPIAVWPDGDLFGFPPQGYCVAKRGEMTGVFGLPEERVQTPKWIHSMTTAASSTDVLFVGNDFTALIRPSADAADAAPVFQPSVFIVPFRAGSSLVVLDGAMSIQAANPAVFARSKLTVSVASNSPPGGGLTLARGGRDQLEIVGNGLVHAGVPVGTFSESVRDGRPVLSVEFNSSASGPALNAVLRNVAYVGVPPDLVNIQFEFTDLLGRASPAVAIAVLPAPQILDHSTGGEAELGTNFTLTASFTASRDIRTQWRLNGIPVGIFTNYTYLAIPNFQLGNAGNYSVVGANAAGLAISSEIHVAPKVPLLQGGDAFEERLRLSGLRGAGKGNNRTASFEPGEHLHAGKLGGKSVWFEWEAPGDGIASFGTMGSAFDTLLAVYSGTSLTDLVEVGSDDDQGGFTTSKVSFRTVRGGRYFMALDGVSQVAGEYVVSWEVEVTGDFLPIIERQPASLAVAQGAPAELTIQASGSGLKYEWLFNGFPITGATNRSYLISSVQFSDVGRYVSRVRNDQGRTVETRPAFIETGPSREALSEDKLGDLLARLADGGPAARRGGVAHAMTASPPESNPAWVPVRPGVPGSKLFSNRGATVEASEPNNGENIGGASQWVALRPESDGIMALDTIGSTFDTMLGVYAGKSQSDLSRVAFNDNSDAGRLSSRVEIQVRMGVTYLIAVDGVNGAMGTIRLNWMLSPLDRLTIRAVAGFEAGTFEIRTSDSRRVILQTTSDLVNWTAIYTNDPPNNVVFRENRTALGLRFYRSLLLSQQNLN